MTAQFERNGLKPTGEQSYVQPVKFMAKELDESKSGVVLSKRGKDTPIKLGDEAIIGTRVDLAPEVEGELVFVGGRPLTPTRSSRAACRRCRTRPARYRAPH